MQGTVLNSVISLFNPPKSLPLDRHGAENVWSESCLSMGTESKPSSNNSRKKRKLIQESEAPSHRENRGPCDLEEMECLL